MMINCENCRNYSAEEQRCRGSDYLILYPTEHKELSSGVHCFDLRQTSDLLGVKVRRLRDWIRADKLKAGKRRNRWYVACYEIERILHENEN